MKSKASVRQKEDPGTSYGAGAAPRRVELMERIISWKPAAMLRKASRWERL